MIVDVQLTNTQIFDAKLMEAQTTIKPEIKETVHGLSAYQIAVKNGFVGTEQEWLDSLVGPPGPPGPQGIPGETGSAGADGYTPVKGTDYWTGADKAEMVNDVLAALPNGDEVSY